mmetsp:Transcript_72397/g.209582  ORF Transcript_72397/g.209582 Transcript_72397/m.209582 type:complete len:205 (-) Transcript_72397:261-875(-)
MLKRGHDDLAVALQFRRGKRQATAVLPHRGEHDVAVPAQLRRPVKKRMGTIAALDPRHPNIVFGGFLRRMPGRRQWQTFMPRAGHCPKLGGVGGGARGARGATALRRDEEVDVAHQLPEFEPASRLEVLACRQGELRIVLESFVGELERGAVLAHSSKDHLGVRPDVAGCERQRSAMLRDGEHDEVPVHPQILRGELERRAVRR